MYYSRSFHNEWRCSIKRRSSCIIEITYLKRQTEEATYCDMKTVTLRDVTQPPACQPEAKMKQLWSFLISTNILLMILKRITIYDEKDEVLKVAVKRWTYQIFEKHGEANDSFVASIHTVLAARRRLEHDWSLAHIHVRWWRNSFLFSLVLLD